jgi:hypothetical protein
MNFLQLAQRLALKCRVTGSSLSTTANQGTELARLISYIQEAWMDIQGQRDNWWWMRNSFSFVTVAGKTNYTPTQAGILDFGNWDLETFRNYVTASGISSEILMTSLDYKTWRDQYLLGAQRSTYSRPTVVAIAPDKSVCFGSIAAAGYTILGDYYRVPTELTSDQSTPALPSQYHMAIIYRAMMYYGTSEAAAEIYQEGQAEYLRYMNRIARGQQDSPTIGSALV